MSRIVINAAPTLEITALRAGLGLTVVASLLAFVVRAVLSAGMTFGF